MIFLIILLAVVAFIFGTVAGYLVSCKDMLIPFCTILFGTVSGQAATDFCHTICTTERGEKIARLFYILYRYGYGCTKNPKKAECFEDILDNQGSIERFIRIADLLYGKDEVPNAGER